MRVEAQQKAEKEKPLHTHVSATAAAAAAQPSGRCHSPTPTKASPSYRLASSCGEHHMERNRSTPWSRRLPLWPQQNGCCS